LEHLIYIIIGLYVWEVYLESYWYTLYYSIINTYHDLAPKSLKDIPSWLKNKVWVWVKSKL
jgi:hypothetical protein